MHQLLSRLCLKRNLKGVVSQYFQRHSSSGSFKPYYDFFFKYSENLAVVDNCGAFKYKDIINSSYLIAKRIQTLFPNSKEKSERISFLCSSDATYVSVLLACWITGNIAVPLCSSHPESLLKYYIEDSNSKLVISNAKFSSTIENIISKSNTSFFTVDHDVFSSASSPKLIGSEFFSWDDRYKDRDALIIYTSGTTGRPKGVVLTHGTLHSQTYAVIKMWDISDKDSILHSLPLHHIHGIMNALLCPLKCGGTVVMQQKFNAVEAWQHFMALEDKPRVNIYFAVPTMYAKLVQEFDKLGESVTNARNRCQQNMRIFCSGSASLPIPVFEGIENITSHRIVERFGMSEIGMALSNTLTGSRTPGTVGVPLPEVEVKLRKPNEGSEGNTDVVVGNENFVKILSGKDGDSGELLVRGPAVFKKYWNKEKATQEAFTEDGWFLTGDTVSYEGGLFRILGRTSVDIIKSGGYKISALEVESCLLAHPDISECTVLGLPDEIWGERVTAVILLKKGKTLEDIEIKEWCKKFIPPYAAPTVIKRVESIPRNVIGKVNKKELKTQLIT